MMRFVRWTAEHRFDSTFLFLFLFGLNSLAWSGEIPQKKYWVYFRDKGPESVGIQSLHKGLQLYDVARATLTDRALKRRAKVLSANNLVDPSDLPVYQPYLDELAKLGIRPHVTSRWFNAISAYLTPDKVSSVAALPFVKEVVPVITFIRDKDQVESAKKEDRESRPQSVQGLNYGQSLEQLTAINVPPVHELEINGTGVLIGMLDSGFRWKTHEALKNIHVVAEHDFIFNDDNTADEPNDPPGQDYHGTATLSVIGGFMPGQLIGTGYGASLILGKTEYLPTETRVEEDNWVAGIEWMEAKGADVVSSSLGYNIFDPPDTSYTYQDMNGRTATTSKAAVIAARKGVVVCNAMGNEGGNTWRHMIAPADADSIISVGAVNFSGVLASFSSVGPTSDGRIKPDVVAPGVSVYYALNTGSNTYDRWNGTSFSCPLTAGVAALVLSAHPEYTPIQVRDALRNTASRAARPDNFYGWGIVDAQAAVLLGGLVFSNLPHVYYNDQTNIVATYVTSRFGVDNLAIRFRYSLDRGKTFASLQMLPTTKQNLFIVTVPKQASGTFIQYYIDGVDQGGINRRIPYNSPDSLFSFRYGEGDTSRLTAKPIPLVIPTGFFLYQNYPNPFNPSTTIQFYAPEEAEGEVAIYNTLGERVKTVFSGKVFRGNNFVRWNSLDDRGKRASSGVYFYRFRTAIFSDTKRMLLIK